MTREEFIEEAERKRAEFFNKLRRRIRLATWTIVGIGVLVWLVYTFVL